MTAGGTIPLSSFVGRERELALIAGAQARGERLITNTGAPGIGKTRLALEVLRSGEPDPVAAIGRRRSASDSA